MLDIFFNLFGQITPLLILISLGYIAGRFLDVNLPSLVTVAIYIIAPYVNFIAIAQLELQWNYAILPVYMFCTSAFIGFSVYSLARYFWRDKAANLVAMSSVTGNSGYFGLPIILYLYGPEWVGVYLFMNLGMFLNEIGLGYYFGARGDADFKGAVKKVLKLPVIYAIILGFIANIMGFEPTQTMVSYWNHFLGVWIVIGMMLIGTALSKQSKIDVDRRLLVWMLVPRFIIWPLMGFILVCLDVFVFNLFPNEIYGLVIVFSSVPLAGNVVAFASNLNLYPEKAAGAVLISTILSLFTLPLIVYLLQSVV